MKIRFFAEFVQKNKVLKQVFFIFYPSTTLAHIIHNVPAVCDGLTVHIRALRSKDQGWQTVGGVSRGSATA
jgi:hypothetical protein